jgi:dihydroorotase
LIVDSVLTNAKAYLKGELVECSLAIEEGKILKIGREPQMPNADEKTNLHGMLLLPGLIDAHVHLRDEEKAYKETFYTGTAAAAAGGFTTVLDMPNNEPLTASAQTLKNRMQLAKRRVIVNVGFYATFPEDSEEIASIASEGAVGFKLFMAEQVGGLNLDDDEALKEALKQTVGLQVPVAAHAEDKALLKKATDELKLAKRDDLNAFLKAHDPKIEVAAIEHLLRLNAEPKARLHFCHVSTKGGLEAITHARKKGETATCEVTPHHLLVSSAEYSQLGSRAVTMPPLRSREHVDALWKGIAEGTVDTVGSDHAPHTLEEKEASSIWDTKVGVPGLETTLPLMLTMVHKNRLQLPQLLELLAEKPAEIFRLPNKGHIVESAAADLVVVDFKQRFKIDASKFQSKAKFSPFNGWDVQGKPVKTYVNGTLAMDDGQIVAKPGAGAVVRSGYA